MPQETPPGQVEDDRYFGFLASDVSRLLRTEFDRRVRRIGLTRSQWMVLTRLYRVPGASQSELADLLEMEKASAGRLVDRLEANGWVERRPDPADRRIKRIHVTAEAERVQRSMQRVAHGVVDDVLSVLDEAERAQLSELMLRVKTRAQALVQKELEDGGNPDARAAAEALTVEAAIR